MLGKSTWNLVLENCRAIPSSNTDWPISAEPGRQKTETTFNLFDTTTLPVSRLLTGACSDDHALAWPAPINHRRNHKRRAHIYRGNISINMTAFIWGAQNWSEKHSLVDSVNSLTCRPEFGRWLACWLVYRSENRNVCGPQGYIGFLWLC